MAAPRLPDDFVTVVCPTCHARLSARRKHAGKRLACPDCGVPIEIPLPEPPDSRVPAEPRPVGEYRVAESAASRHHADDLITVVCPTCHARLSARWDMAGRRRKCPDCGVKIHIPFPEARRTDPGPDAQKIGHYEVDAAPEKARVATQFLDQQAVIFAVPLPEPPRWTFFSGVFQFPWYRNTLARWLCLSAGLLAWGELVVGALALVGVGGEGVGGIAIVAVGFMVLPIVWVSVWTYSYAASCLLAIVQETASGNDLITWPEDTWRDRFWKLLYVGYLAVLAALAGAGVASLLEWQTGIFWPALAITGCVLFPIILLSSLERDSTWAVLSPVIVRSLFVVMWGWLVFYSFAALLGVLAALPIGAGYYLRHQFAGVVLAAPVAAAAVLIYARLLGRLAWRITERLEPSAETLDHSKT